MIIKVGEEDFIGYKNTNAWLKNHPGSAVIFDSPEKVWPHIMDAYKTSFKQMVYGDLPSESNLLDTLGKISDRIKPIDWHIDNQTRGVPILKIFNNPNKADKTAYLGCYKDMDHASNM